MRYCRSCGSARSRAYRILYRIHRNLQYVLYASIAGDMPIVTLYCKGHALATVMVTQLMLTQETPAAASALSVYLDEKQKDAFSRADKA